MPPPSPTPLSVLMITSLILHDNFTIYLEEYVLQIVNRLFVPLVFHNQTVCFIYKEENLVGITNLHILTFTKQSLVMNLPGMFCFKLQCPHREVDY